MPKNQDFDEMSGPDYHVATLAHRPYCHDFKMPHNDSGAAIEEFLNTTYGSAGVEVTGLVLNNFIALARVLRSSRAQLLLG